jgi:hypothetical protein
MAQQYTRWVHHADAYWQSKCLPEEIDLSGRLIWAADLERIKARHEAEKARAHLKLVLYGAEPDTLQGLPAGLISTRCWVRALRSRGRVAVSKHCRDIAPTAPRKGAGQ